jgi:hypothetical protein
MARCAVPLHLCIHLKIQADKQKIVLLRNADRSDKLLKGSADPSQQTMHSFKTGLGLA